MVKRYFILLLLLTPNFSWAFEGVYTVIIQKQQAKASSRWTLGDWLATKKKMALMDQWLALHSSTQIFELYLGGGEGHFDIFHTNDSTQGLRILI